MNPSLYALSANMINQLNRVDNISNNLANLNTVGYKERGLVEGSFNNVLNKSIEDRKDITNYEKVINTVPKIDGHVFNNKNGAMVETGNTLDFAIDKENVYMRIQKENGEIGLTRNGELKSNKEGFLVTNNNDYLLDKDNNKININNENFINRISLLEIEQNDLKRDGNNVYLPDNINALKEFNDREVLKQGYIEKSNVNPIQTMTLLIETQRNMERSQKAISGLSDLSSKLIEKLSS